MKSLKQQLANNNNNVSLMAQQFQNLGRRATAVDQRNAIQSPPPPPQSLPPDEPDLVQQQPGQQQQQTNSQILNGRPIRTNYQQQMQQADSSQMHQNNGNNNSYHQNSSSYSGQQHQYTNQMTLRSSPSYLQQQQQQQQRQINEPIQNSHHYQQHYNPHQSVSHQSVIETNNSTNGQQPQQQPSPPTLSQQPSPGISRLIEDLQNLVEDHETADIVFLADANEQPIYAHWLILRARCKSFQNIKRGELCKIFGVTVSPANGTNARVIRWPQANADHLRDVISYIYTGKILIEESNIFDALAIGGELGLEELANRCEDYAKANINVHNACAYLDAALKFQQRTTIEPETNQIVSMCLHYISENAIDCAKTQTFLNLSKEGITYLVSSDYFSLDEADVFRYTLTWAKHQAGVAQPTQHWTEDERTRICQQLSGVINHIRILLIDSQVFAKEVEPTGVVPMELSLERYRFAALTANNNSKQSLDTANGDNKRIQPRLKRHSNRLFANSKLLSDDNATDMEQILNAWHGGTPKQNWKLIFRASAHNFSADAFHNHCDGISPTYILILGSKGYLSGGYSDVAWSRGNQNGRGRYAASEKAFLFTLQSPETKMTGAVRYTLNKKMFAIAHHANFGPVFGAGADLSIAHDCHRNEESYSNLPHSYGTDNSNASPSSMFGDYNFTVIDYEVFTLA